MANKMLRKVIDDLCSLPENELRTLVLRQMNEADILEQVIGSLPEAHIVFSPEHRIAYISRQVQGILLGAVLIAACGAIDDIISLRAWIKLIIQIVAAVVAVAHGVVIEVFSNPNIFNSDSIRDKPLALLAITMKGFPNRMENTVA